MIPQSTKLHAEISETRSGTLKLRLINQTMFDPEFFRVRRGAKLTEREGYGPGQEAEDSEDKNSLCHDKPS